MSVFLKVFSLGIVRLCNEDYFSFWLDVYSDYQCSLALFLKIYLFRESKSGVGEVEGERESQSSCSQP